MKRTVILCCLIATLVFGSLVVSASPPSQASPSVQKVDKAIVTFTAFPVDRATVATVEEVPIGNYAEIVHCTVARDAFAGNQLRTLQPHVDGVDHVPLN